MPPKYDHHPPYRITYLYDCHFRVFTHSLVDALAIANAKDPEALICVWAGASRVFVGIYAWKARNKPLEDVYALFDRAGDAQIDGLMRKGMWSR